MLNSGQVERPPGPRREFWCFISYRHADNREPGRQWATWLHQQIETYEVPADLVGTVNDRGDTIPERIFPVFRDEEELPVDADLGNAITNALEASKFLIVVCSPRAVESSYVASEIRYFKRLGREDRVLAVMVDGEPNASDDQGKQKDGYSPGRECFPEPLRRRVDAEGRLLDELCEPVAADFRIHLSEGWTSREAYRQQLRLAGKLSRREVETEVETYGKRTDLMKLKIIAGVLGVSLGRLTARDQAYQLRRARQRARIFAGVGIVFGMLALLAVVAGIFAWRQKGEAEKQRAAAEGQKREAVAARDAAEGLVQFMTYDLKEKLQPIGRLELLDEVNRRTRDYYTNFPPPAGDTAAEGRRAAGLSSQGEILNAQGDLVGALQAHEQAMAIRQRLAALDLRNVGWQLDVVGSHNNIGDT